MNTGSTRVRRGLVPLAIGLACVFGSPVLGASLDATAATREARIPDVTELFDRAVEKVRAARDGEFSRAFLLEANGKPADGQPVKNAAGIVRWRFVFNTGSNSSRFYSATISYGPPPKRFGRVIPYESPFLGDNPIRTAPEMTLREAVSLLRDAGYQERFHNVTLRDPVGPTSTPPLYIFTLGEEDWVAVNTKTGKVKPIR